MLTSAVSPLRGLDAVAFLGDDRKKFLEDGECSGVRIGDIRGEGGTSCCDRLSSARSNSS